MRGEGRGGLGAAGEGDTCLTGAADGSLPDKMRDIWAAAAAEGEAGASAEDDG